ncbi:TetR/AcrR family transcriptional regulator [Gordonia neofelifaecis]|uniref:Putative transcriptional regulator n=1 Tax=Gordonia neofelifaecis NRRL B-59395 TaxID=644548 RepID=F1YKF2_9ACTN|nr:TetR family transcriptional regulator [Gordonia neofelifaecis]EGD54838.1 putative transcriptional regulator [Gordonia neofelifaecis NRRL B-59395]
MSAPAQSTPSFAEASKQLLRTTLLDGLRTLLREKDWARVTMADVAKQAGVSRQTVYNEFASRAGLSQAYALRLADEFTTEIGIAIDANVDDVTGALRSGFAAFFASAADDPLIQSLLSGEAKPDLLKLITTDAAPIISAASARLEVILVESWVAVDQATAGRIARMITRMALSYVAMPPDADADSDVADDLASVLAPAVIAARG